MGKLVLLDCRHFASGVDLSGSGNKLEVNEEFEAKAVTNWRSGGAEELLGGLAKVQLSAEGQLEQAVDESFWANRRVLEPHTFGPTDESDTSVGALLYLTRMLRTKHTWLGEVGAVSPWTLDAVGSWPLARGRSAHPSGTPRTGNGSEAGVNLGAVADGEHLYANLHVLSAAGTTPNLTVSVQSDSADTFGSPTTLGFFAARSTPGGQATRFAGPITDTWFRVSWTITGTTPSFLFLVSLGVE